jgi:membrane associated rhomboid family serine protease
MSIPIDDLQTHATILGSFVALLWLLEAIDQLLFRGRLDRLGIRPRTQIGLRGILFAPLLHGTWKHLSANTLPLLVLGWLVMLRGIQEFAIATSVVWLVSGLGTWLFGGANTLHIGASGLVFGYFGILLSRGYFDQDALSAVSAVLVVLLYGPLIWGVLPLRRGVSWQAHLFGFLGGILVTRYFL